MSVYDKNRYSYLRVILIAKLLTLGISFFRIACSSSNPFLENNYQQCISNPGCFFDQELANVRFTIGQAILPGVPVCQLAIRNQAFHKRARESQTKVIIIGFQI